MGTLFIEVARPSSFSLVNQQVLTTARRYRKARSLTSVPQRRPSYRNSRSRRCWVRRYNRWDDETSFRNLFKFLSLWGDANAYNFPRRSNWIPSVHRWPGSGWRGASSAAWGGKWGGVSSQPSWQTSIDDHNQWWRRRGCIPWVSVATQRLLYRTHSDIRRSDDS